jgi:peptide methionine sulfoxide reductase MsrB
MVTIICSCALLSSSGRFPSKSGFPVSFTPPAHVSLGSARPHAIDRMRDSLVSSKTQSSCHLFSFLSRETDQ